MPVDTANLAFVVSTGAEGPNPELRRLIRSHVMLGKNRGRLITRKPRDIKTREARPEETQQGVSSSPLSSRLKVSDLSPAPCNVEPQPCSVVALPVTVPHKFGSDLATIHFADAIEPPAVEVVLHFSSIAKQVLFSLEPCILFERRADAWVAPLTTDPAYLHAMIFTSQYYFEVLSTGKPFSPTANRRLLPHYLETLRILRDRLAHANDRSRLSFTTAATIMVLAGYALLIDDSLSARHHLNGLGKIVSLRGGAAAFAENPKLLVEILRCDIGAALHSGSRPVFFNGLSTGQPCLPYPDLTPLLKLQDSAGKPTYLKPNPFLGEIDDRLAQTWRAVWSFSSTINFATSTTQRISTETFLDTMASVVYRLIDMRSSFEATSRNEAIRLGLLAFCCSVFLQWKSLGVPYAHLACAMRACLNAFPSSRLCPQLLLWLLMVGTVSLFDGADNSWLRPMLLTNMRLCEIHSWSEIQRLLSSFIWINFVHDKPGKTVFDSLISRRSGQSATLNQ